MNMKQKVAHAYTRAGFHFRTEAEPAGKDWFEWRIGLSDPPAKLESIKEVEYILHPTFPQRVRRVTDRESGFSLEAEGWGDFDILVNLYFRDGDEKSMVVPLKLT